MILEKMKKMVSCCLLIMLFVCGVYLTKAYAAEFSDAVPIQVNEIITGSVTKGYNYEQNYYMFTLEAPGSVTIHFENPIQDSSNECWKVSLYDEEHHALLSSSMRGNYTSHNCVSMGVPEGIYYVKVTSAYSSEAASTDMYSFSVNYTMSDTWEKEINDSFLAATMVRPNVSYSGTTCDGYNYDPDYYYVELEEAGSLTVNFSNPLQGHTSSCWKVSLYNESYGKMYSQSIYGNAASTNLPAMGLDAGKYYVLVESANSSSAASIDVYALTLNFTPSDMWEKEDNDSFKTATPIEAEKVYYGTTCDGYSYEKDYYSVNIPANGTYNIQFDAPDQNSTNRFWNVYLYDSSYQEIASMDIYGNGATQRITKMLAADIYYIRVSSSYSSDAASTDIYELTVTKYVFNPIKPKKVTLVSAKAGNNMAVLSWKKVSGASGYEVYMSRSKSGGYKRIRTLSATSYKKKGLTRGQRYYFKVRAYRYGADGRKVNGSFSNVKSVLVK